MRARARVRPPSAFTRLLLVFVATGLLLNLLVVGFFAWTMNSHGVRPADRQIADYISFLVGELGDPPSLERALQISRRSALAIAYEGPRGRWSAGREAGPWRHLRFREIEGYAGVRIGGQGGRQVVVVERGQERFVFELPRRLARPPAPVRLLSLVAAVVTLLLGGAWLVIRQVFRPLKHIADGVAQVAAGNLSHAVPEVGAREFATLARAFNAMTGQVKQMLAMRERLLLDASHELRSPLTRMKVAIEFIPPGSARESIREDLLEMEHLVTATLESARLARAGETILRARLDLAAVLRRVAARFADRPPGVRLEQVPAGCWIEGDADLVAAVLRNILDNAVKYSGGGAVPVSVALERRDGQARVTVRDSGPGIPAADLPRIFDPFYRVDPSRSRDTGGYGLGLSLCTSIVAAHRGQIAVESTVGVGTTVTVAFPAAGEPGAPEGPAGEERRDAP
jgi:signal transduction histidine kinase